mgnify:FL=1
MKAGRRKRRKTGTKRRRGGMASLLNQAIVPFGLTYLATRKGRRGSKRRGSKRRRSRRGGSKRRRSRRGGSRTKRGGDGEQPRGGGRRKRRKRRRSSRR